MATVNEMALCPKCSTELAKGATKCTTCNFQLPYQTEFFGTPDYLNSQLQTVLGNISEKDKQFKHYQDKARLEHLRFLTNMSDDDRAHAMQDAFDILSVIISSNSQGANLKRILELGKRVGVLAEATDKIIRAGGTINGLFDTAQPRVGRSNPLEPGGAGDIDS